MKYKLIFGLIVAVLLFAQGVPITGMASGQSASDVHPCSAEFEPASGSMYAEGGVPVEHNNPQDCEMNHMSSAS